MRRQPRWRRIAIWTGIVTSALIAAAWALSGCRYVNWEWNTQNGGWVWVWVRLGRLDVVRFSGAMYDFKAAGPWPGMIVQGRNRDVGMPSAHWNLRRPFYWGGPDWNLSVPLWLPFLLIAPPTVLLFHRSRRIPPGHCQTCRYDLTGIATATCPECGAATKIHVAAPQPGEHSEKS